MTNLIEIYQACSKSTPHCSSQIHTCMFPAFGSQHSRPSLKCISERSSQRPFPLTWGRGSGLCPRWQQGTQRIASSLVVGGQSRRPVLRAAPSPNLPHSESWPWVWPRGCLSKPPAPGRQRGFLGIIAALIQALPLVPASRGLGFASDLLRRWLLPPAVPCWYRVLCKRATLTLTLLLSPGSLSDAPSPLLYLGALCTASRLLVFVNCSAAEAEETWRLSLLLSGPWARAGEKLAGQ